MPVASGLTWCYIYCPEKRGGGEGTPCISDMQSCATGGWGGGEYSPLFGVGIGPIKVLDIPLGNSEQFDNKLQS